MEPAQRALKREPPRGYSAFRVLFREPLYISDFFAVFVFLILYISRGEALESARSAVFGFGGELKLKLEVLNYEIQIEWNILTIYQLFY